MAPTVVVEPVQFLDDAEVARLLASIGKATVEDVRDAALFRVLASGLRRGELIGLRVTDVDLDTRTLTIRAATSKTRQGRTVAISRDAAQAPADLPARQERLPRPQRPQGRRHAVDRRQGRS